MNIELNHLTVLIRGGGELASGVARRLHQCHFKVCLTEVPDPLAVRREVAFSEAVHLGSKEIEGVTARLVEDLAGIQRSWQRNEFPLLIDPDAVIKNTLKPHVMVDATLAKRNLGTSLTDAPLVIGLGVGFEAGIDTHVVIETNRGHNLGKVIHQGKAEPDTGIPGEISGFTVERVLRAPVAGIFTTGYDIGDRLRKGQTVATVAGIPLKAELSGVIRGLLRNGTAVKAITKVGDIDPRGVNDYCFTVSDKALAIAGGVLEAILARFNT
ncbi:selenium-dependent molybdenum cofactor biosynthesis protein YqeB [Chloroflexota bacterium]